ncbi:DUF4253 domain-containing protein [Streptomyces sp. NPDC059070]|uniref:DUF4253 domain-containing protein n=1 Tax=unclassified Streptomyces TaxID=2593676 RepID=UPI0034E2A488
MAMLPNPLPALTADPTGAALGLDLPPGRLFGDGPLLWRAESPAAPGDWARLLPARLAAGLQPVLVGGKYGLDQWELAPEEMTYPGDHDAEDVLAEVWEEFAEEELGAGDWPGLAEGPALQEDPDVRAGSVADGSWPKDARLALVPARRSADIPAALGWSGALNLEEDTGRLSAVLRSWEDRFGVRVVGLAFDELLVSVAAPPTTLEQARAVAAEHFAFCPDVIEDSLEEYARDELLNSPSWHFWWD